MSSPFFQNSEGIEKVKDILSTLETTANGYAEASPERQAMYVQGLNLWAQDLQEAIQALGHDTNTTTPKGVQE